MKRLARHLVFAFLAWLVPFGASVCLFPLKKTHAALFDSLMGVVLAASTAFLFWIESRRSTRSPIVHAMNVGLLWMSANWLLDASMFSAGPLKMTFGQYFADIGVAYLMIPAITLGMGAAARSARSGLEPLVNSGAPTPQTGSRAVQSC